eukprot:2823820-Lingulodinium_polyedra.AAC.1
MKTEPSGAVARTGHRPRSPRRAQRNTSFHCPGGPAPRHDPGPVANGRKPASARPPAPFCRA